MEKQELKTTATIDGRMIEAEEVNYCGLNDYCMLSYFQTGLSTTLQHFVAETMADGTVWREDIQNGVYTMFDVLDDVTRYKEQYLTRRIIALENALGLQHNGNIDE